MPARIDFQTEPARYRHWKLAFAGDVAELIMDVDENAGLFEGYQLKLNSYDLGVDIELADAVQRLRFEHPEVKVVVLRSGKDRVFCAGANIRMLAGSSHTHKVNFCKFTNETRNGMEDASQGSGQKYLCAIRGTAAGGGYELALATDHILLADDGSSTVALPELPLLAVLPGTGGLTRVTDKRKVRRDFADAFCTTEEGVRGARAVKWRLVDQAVSNSKFEQAVADAARKLAAKSDRPTGEKGIALTPIERKIEADAITYSSVKVEIERDARRATITILGPGVPPPSSVEAMVEEGAAFWPLRLARELDDAILHLRLNEPEIGVLIFKTQGEPARVLAFDQFLDANKGHWLAREILHYWKRTLKRVDMTSRSLVALIEPGSCFAGTLAELAFACDRSFMLIGGLPGDNRPPATLVLSALNFGAYPMGNDLTRLATRFLGEPQSVDEGQSRDRQIARGRGLRKPRPRDGDARTHRLGRRGAHLPGGALLLLRRRPHRHGGEPALRRPGDHGDEDLRPAHRLAELDLPAPQRSRRRRCPQTLRHRRQGQLQSGKGLSVSGEMVSGEMVRR